MATTIAERGIADRPTQQIKKDADEGEAKENEFKYGMNKAALVEDLLEVEYFSSTFSFRGKLSESASLLANRKQHYLRCT